MKVIDMHCDTISRLYDDHKIGKEGSLLSNQGHLDLNKMKKGDYLLQNFAMFVHLDKYPQSFLRAHQLIDYYYQQIEQYSDMIKPIYCYQDILDNEKAGVMSAMLTLEEGAVVENDLALLRNYYRLGVRMITLTWNFSNGIGFPNFTRPQKFEDTYHINEQDGLTDFGITYVQEMERLGMIIDVSHLGDAGFYDVYHHTTKPFVASHSNARSLCHVARNMSDDMILKLASRGGVMGINFYGDFLLETPTGNAPSRIEDMVKHILYIKDLAGIDCIGLGSDFDGLDSQLEIKDASFYQLLKDALFKAGLSQEDIEKIFYKNVLRVYQQILK